MASDRLVVASLVSALVAWLWWWGIWWLSGGDADAVRVYIWAPALVSIAAIYATLRAEGST